ncbi:MAG: coproporphyrinogen III oxidase family protein [Victivallaceae bacterium]|nr:coproporphyrinogen III oxidase family protein [Victivallaceae bacterium]
MNYYIHVPFCRSKCAYCAFYSESAPSPATSDAFSPPPEEPLGCAPRDEAETLYLGGGTPTLLDEKRLEKLFSLLKTYIPLAPGAEISSEANPETLDPGKIAVMRAFVTRVSVGVQSFSADKRARLGRVCSDAALASALEEISAAEFAHFNCDLIYGVPGESEAAYREEFSRLADYPVDHLSCYALTPEEGSRLGGGFPVDDDLADVLWEKSAAWAEKYLGMKQYEISNYAAPGGKCRHNCAVWRGGLLRGFGPAASSFDGVDRFTEKSDLDGWLAGVPPEIDRIGRIRRLNEIFAVNLRTTEGWRRAEWEKVPGADAWEMRRVAAENLQKRYSGVILYGNDFIRLTRKGLRFWNIVAEELL